HNPRRLPAADWILAVVSSGRTNATLRLPPIPGDEDSAWVILIPGSAAHLTGGEMGRFRSQQAGLLSTVSVRPVLGAGQVGSRLDPRSKHAWWLWRKPPSQRAAVSQRFGSLDNRHIGTATCRVARMQRPA